jgi:hypothetical protein
MMDFDPHSVASKLESVKLDRSDKRARGMVYFDIHHDPILVVIGTISDSQILVCRSMKNASANKGVHENEWQFEKSELLDISNFNYIAETNERALGFADLVVEIESFFKYNSLPKR